MTNATRQGLMSLYELIRSRNVDVLSPGAQRGLSYLFLLSQLKEAQAAAGGSSPPPGGGVTPIDPSNPPPVIAGAGELGVSAQISVPGGWLLLEDMAGGYELHADSFAQRQVGHRKVDVTSGFVEGSFTVRSVRDQVIEQLVVEVVASSPYFLQRRVAALTDALDAVSYLVQVQTGDLLETWTCSTADYVLETSQPLQFATRVVVRASVPRLPGVLTQQVTS